MPQTQSTGWQLTLTEPNSGRTVSPDVVGDPQFLPSLNSLVEARIPIRKSQDWLNWPTGTTVSLTLDGRDQPIDELVDIEQQTEQTILICEGGIELDERLKREFNEERRHLAAEDIIQNDTPYIADVDTPTFPTVNDQLLQDADTQTEYNNLVSIATTTPLKLSNGTFTTEDSAFINEAENASFIDGDLTSRTDFSDGDGILFNARGDELEFNISINYEIDASNFDVYVRCEEIKAGDFTNLRAYDSSGNAISDIISPTTNLEWISADFFSSLDNFTGSETIRIRPNQSSPSGNTFGEVEIDVVAFVDDRYSYTFDNTVDEDNGYLDGPEPKPNAVDVVFNDATTPFVITEATGNITIDDTTNDQALALSADLGQTFTEATNTDTVTVTGLDTTQVRLRVTLSRYSANGERSQTPQFGYTSQELDAHEILADIRQESLLLDEIFDDSVESVLNEIAGDEFIWSYNLDSNGNGQVSWTQPGQRTSSQTPDIDAETTVNKSVKTFNAVTIKGSTQSVTGEQFTADTSFVTLNQGNIVPGSESVTDGSGTVYQRGEDYKMNFIPGEIRALSTGNLTTGNTFTIDYRYEIEGTHPEGFSGSNELVETIPGIVSERNAQQIAFVILNIDPEVSAEGFTADVLLPRSDAVFDPLNALSLENLELPDNATPLAVREPPEQTPAGIRLQLGGKRELERTLQTISEQVRKVSRRS